MNTTTIVFLLTGIVILSISMIVVSQMRERARIERIRKTTAQEDAFRRSSRLLADIPGQYLTPALKLELVRAMEDACAELTRLKPGPQVDSWRSATAELKTQITEKSAPVAPVKIDSVEKSKQVKELLESLFKLIEARHKRRRIDAAAAKKHLKHVLFLIHKTHADLHIFQAKDLLREHQTRRAIHAYHLATAELNKSRDTPAAAKAIKTLQARIKQLEARANAKADGQHEDDSTLDREWDSFLHDDEWKKKADYDD